MTEQQRRYLRTRTIVRRLALGALLVLFAWTASAVQLQTPGWQWWAGITAVPALTVTVCLLRRQQLGDR